VPNIRPKPNIRWFFAAEYSVSAEIENSFFGRTLTHVDNAGSRPNIEVQQREKGHFIENAASA
jgi:hypothetical protein